MTSGPKQDRSHLNKSAPVTLELCLGHDPPHSSRPVFISPKPTVNPIPSSLGSHSLSSGEDHLPQMAYQRADPGPFLPEGMQLQQIENRQVMVIVVAKSRLVPRHEDWAIATIHPLPSNVLDFDAVREVLEEFFTDVARVQIRDIQRSHLGQALVRFYRVYDRDTLIQNSPHQFDNVAVSFVKHNQGRNWRHVTFNREVWLMLLGFPFDYCGEEYFDNALAPFGKMINWDKNPDHKNRLMVRVSTPFYCLF